MAKPKRCRGIAHSTIVGIHISRVLCQRSGCCTKNTQSFQDMIHNTWDHDCHTNIQDTSHFDNHKDHNSLPNISCRSHILPFCNRIDDNSDLGKNHTLHGLKGAQQRYILDIVTNRMQAIRFRRLRDFERNSVGCKNVRVLLSASCLKASSSEFGR